MSASRKADEANTYFMGAKARQGADRENWKLMGFQSLAEAVKELSDEVGALRMEVDRISHRIR